MTPALLSGVLAASIIGSVHCIAMCGPLVGLHGGARTLRLSLIHSLGRLLTYVTLGTLAGLVGSAIDLAGRLGNIQRAATVVGAITILAIALVPLLAKARPPARAPFTAALVRIRSRSEVRRAALIGALTGLLPCGWLWAFVVMAAGTASAPAGALVMATFWLGTAPAMIGVVRLAGPLITRMRARMPAITAVVLIAAGLGTLALRWQDAGTMQVQAPHCHGAS
jgi:sulfite exporter TauE/SafE